jgi:hypothetical protein
MATSIPSKFTCPLTLELEEPAMTRWGHSFEWEALLKWLECHDVCPLTRNPMSLKDVIVNQALHQRIQAWRKETGQEASMRETSSDKNLPFLVSVKSTKTVIRALEETNDPAGRFALKMFKRDWQEMKRRKRAAATAA